MEENTTQNSEVQCDKQPVSKFKNPKIKKILFVSLGIALVIAAVILILEFCICEIDDCFKSTYGSSEYCILHKCSEPGCNLYGAYDGYCYYDKYVGSSSSSGLSGYGSGYGSYGSMYSDLIISNVKISHNSVSTICTGTVKNKGNKSYDFVKVRGAFKNSSGSVVDTDWTYAVGSEGLRPGESTTFTMYVDKNTGITKCTVSIYN